MQQSQFNIPRSHTPSSVLHEGQFYTAPPQSDCLHAVLYRVVPAGKNFFHILEVPSGRIKGFRSDHNQACKLAQQLEAIMYTRQG